MSKGIEVKIVSGPSEKEIKDLFLQEKEFSFLLESGNTVRVKVVSLKRGEKFPEDFLLRGNFGKGSFRAFYNTEKKMGRLFVPI